MFRVPRHCQGFFVNANVCQLDCKRVHEIDRSLEDRHILVWYLEVRLATLVSEDATCRETDHAFCPYHAQTGLCVASAGCMID